MNHEERASAGNPTSCCTREQDCDDNDNNGVTWISLTSDKSVRKRVTVEDGEKKKKKTGTEKVTDDGKNDEDLLSLCPSRGSKCFVHYTLALADRKEEVLFSTLAGENRGSIDAAPIEVVLSKNEAEEDQRGKKEKGLRLCLSSMQKDETCELHCRSEYGYGAEGNFSFPSVPPDSDLVYSVRLVGWVASEVEKERVEMLFEERLQAAQRRRDWGNKEYHDLKYSKALTFFSMGLSYLDEDLLMQLEEPHLAQAQEIKTPLLLNSCMSLMNLARYSEALDAAKRVTRVDPKNAKAWYLVARCCRNKGNIPGAREAITQAEKIAQGTKAGAKAMAIDLSSIREESDKIRQEELRGRAAEKKMYQGMFINNKNNNKKGGGKGSTKQRGEETEEEETKTQGSTVGNFLSGVVSFTKNMIENVKRSPEKFI